jgi:hypothetical protein
MAPGMIQKQSFKRYVANYLTQEHPHTAVHLHYSHHLCRGHIITQSEPNMRKLIFPVKAK